MELNRFQAASNQFRCSIELNEQVWNSRCELVRLHLKCLNPNLALQDFELAMQEKFDLALCYENGSNVFSARATHNCYGYFSKQC